METSFMPEHHELPLAFFEALSFVSQGPERSLAALVDPVLDPAEQDRLHGSIARLLAAAER
jgi:hypothetical protein